jgi:hypothetical protein
VNVSKTLVRLTLRVSSKIEDHPTTTHTFLALEKLEQLAVRTNMGFSDKWLAPIIERLPALRLLVCDGELGSVLLTSAPQGLAHLALELSLEGETVYLKLLEALRINNGRAQIQHISLYCPNRSFLSDKIRSSLVDILALLQARGIDVELSRSAFVSETENVRRYLWYTWCGSSISPPAERY